MMQYTDELVEAVKRFEGFVGNSYKCPAGVWTIGYGHTGANVKSGQRVTEKRAEEMLRADLDRFSERVQRLWTPKEQCQLDALTDFAFNLGVSALEYSTLLKRIREGAKPEAIRSEFLRWIYAGTPKRVLPGLVKRRQWEADRFFGDEL